MPHIDDIAEAARTLARERGLANQHSTRSCAIIVQEERRFRWVANSTYGLAEWGVGHSNPEYKTGRRMGIHDEIMFLLEQNQTNTFSATGNSPATGCAAGRIGPSHPYNAVGQASG